MAGGAHAAFAGWRDRRVRQVGQAGEFFVAVGAGAAVLVLVTGPDGAAQWATATAGAYVAAVGLAILVWSRRAG